MVYVYVCIVIHGITFVIFKEFSLSELNEEDMDFFEDADKLESDVSKWENSNGIKF